LYQSERWRSCFCPLAQANSTQAPDQITRTRVAATAMPCSLAILRGGIDAGVFFCYKEIFFSWLINEGNSTSRPPSQAVRGHPSDRVALRICTQLAGVDPGVHVWVLRVCFPGSGAPQLQSRVPPGFPSDARLHLQSAGHWQLSQETGGGLTIGRPCRERSPQHLLVSLSKIVQRACPLPAANSTQPRNAEGTPRKI